MADQNALLGAGLSMAKSKLFEHPAGPPQHGAMGQTERAFSAASTFLSGILAISASQFLGAPLKLVDPKFYEGYMAWTKESFAVLVTTMTQWWAPTIVRVTGDESMKDQLYQMEDGSLRCNFPHRLVMMANHQLYTDWMYLWWIAYTNKMHGRIYIILKESIKNIPIIGWSAQFYNFIFLSRKWETDRHRFRHHLRKLSDPKDPMWLLIFPEGTNLSQVTRDKSKAWAEKQGIADMKHQLLPRSTGLQFCLQELKPSTNWLYDCTIAYEGVPPGQFGQDIFTLRSSFFEGRPPKSVNMYWRRFKVSEIPVDNDAAFAMWLKNRWTEKDYLLEYFSRHGAFPEGDAVKAMQTENALQKLANGDKKMVIKPATKTAKFISTEVKAGGWEEFLSIFGPITAAATALSSGNLAPENIDFDALLAKVAQQQHANLVATGAAPKGAAANGKRLENDDLRSALAHASKAAGHPLKGSALETITRTAAQSQKDMFAALQQQQQQPPTSLPRPATQSPTEGRNLDPAIKKLIDDAHADTRRRLLRASQPAAAKPTAAVSAAPKVRSAMPMAPMQTLVTRPLSTMAMQTATRKMASSAAAARKAAPSAAKTGGAAKANGTIDATTKKKKVQVANGGKDATAGASSSKGIKQAPQAQSKKQPVPAAGSATKKTKK